MLHFARTIVILMLFIMAVGSPVIGSPTPIAQVSSLTNCPSIIGIISRSF